MFEWFSSWWDTRKFNQRQRKLEIYFSSITKYLPDRLSNGDLFPIDLRVSGCPFKGCVTGITEVPCYDGQRIIVVLHSDEIVKQLCDIGKAIHSSPLAAALIQPPDKVSFLISNQVLCELQGRLEPDADLLVDAIIGHVIGNINIYGEATSAGLAWSPTEDTALNADAYYSEKAKHGDQATICMLMCFMLNSGLASRFDQFQLRLFAAINRYNRNLSLEDATTRWLYDYACIGTIEDLKQHPKLKGLSRCKNPRIAAELHVTAVGLIRKYLPELGI